jgi:hypothetical protein
MESEIKNKTGLMVLEVGLPISLNIFCFYSLFIRSIRIIRAGLLYNTESPDRLIFKRVFLWCWIITTIVQTTGMFFKTDDGKIYWLQYFKLISV